MKKICNIILMAICFIGLVACGGATSEHIGEAKTPAGSSSMKGQHYESVKQKFEDKGFTNIRVEKIDDLVLGWFTEDGDVEEVSVDGDVNYLPDKWVKNDAEVIIKYHTFPEKEAEQQEESSDNEVTNTTEEKETAVLTVENCEELSIILSDKEQIYELYANFAEKYKGRIIKFAGRIDYVANYRDYKTRYDILVSAGDYDPDHQIGPTFKFKNVGVSDLKLNTLYLEDKISVGKNVYIEAIVSEFDSNSGLFYIKPVLITER